MRFLVPFLSPRPDPQSSSGYLVPGFSEPVSLLQKKRASPDDGNGAGREDPLGAQDIAPVGAPPSSHQCAWVPVPRRLVHTAQLPAGAGVGAARGGAGGCVCSRRGRAPRPGSVSPALSCYFPARRTVPGRALSPAHARCIKAQPSRPPQPSVIPDAVRSAPP